MALYELHFWDGSLDQVEAKSILDAKTKARKLNDCGVKSAVLVDEDNDDEDTAPEDSEDTEEDDAVEEDDK